MTETQEAILEQLVRRQKSCQQLVRRSHIILAANQGTVLDVKRPSSDSAVTDDKKYQWGYIYGTMELTTGTTELLFAPTVSLSASQVFIDQLVAANVDAIHVIIWDQGGFHQKAELYRLGEQVRVLPIPPYCWELNPMENLWELVKGEVANTVFSTLEEIETKIESILSPF